MKVMTGVEEEEEEEEGVTGAEEVVGEGTT